MSDLSSVNVGDLIAVTQPFGGRTKLVKVERITSSQVIAGGVRFNKSTGREVGTSKAWGAHNAFVPDEARLKRIVLDERIRVAERLLQSIDVTTENLSAVEAFLKACGAAK